MSEKYILMGRGMPSIIPNDQTTPGTRLTATEARQYARRLVELADELTPADPPAPSGDRSTSADDALNSLEVAYIEATAGILRESMSIREWEAARELRQETADRLILALKARLDVVTKERDQLRQRNDYLRARLNVYLQESTDG